MGWSGQLGLEWAGGVLQSSDLVLRAHLRAELALHRDRADSQTPASPQATHR